MPTAEAYGQGQEYGMPPNPHAYTTPPGPPPPSGPQVPPGPPSGPNLPPHQGPAPGQGFPQGPGYPQGPAQGYPQGQGHPPAPGYGPAPGGKNPYAPHPYPPYGPPPKRRNNALIITLCIVLGVLLLGGGTIGAVAYLNRPDPSTTAALTTTAPTPAPTRTQQSAAPSDSPAPEKEPTTAPPSSSESPLRHDEFKDWNFQLGAVKFAAQKVAGWTYDTCDAVDGEGVLAKYDCESAVQLAYSAYGGHLKAVQLIMAFPSTADAKSASNRLQKLTSTAVKWRTDKIHRKYTYGKILSGSALKYVLVTIVTTDNTAAKAKATKFQEFLQTDHANYFVMRGEALTS
ncbi:hypothetical protein Nocox_06770 [Nonomuraea coxensis DSM 45129]|uniref:Uncharacterized protein n=1 Tax=Nonomuraea coxensis DSM 45129 TaxID=1122611 RepID=A0ABX8TUS0_9ACTN|nr:hypothetical protein [Nonomuraea coxensis]QYC38981.1 hypothetical protein Nocox_06770 [Nonomuraea coxensis DSM 45129]